MILETLPEIFVICKLAPDAGIPEWALTSSIFSITKTNEELSIVCVQTKPPTDLKAERDWRCFRVKGTLDFGLTGVLASLANPLAQAAISIFAISTFDTDYLMVKQSSFEKAVTVLSKAGHEVVS